MPIPSPELDDRTFAALLDEARARIRTEDPEWTNHNVSDPGITLIELFAWLTEMLVYRTGRVPDQHVRTFLKLLNGPGWTPGTDLDADVRATVLGLRAQDRAVTAGDYERLAAAAAPGIARTRCVPRRDLSGDPAADRPGHVSVVVVPGAPDQLAAVRADLDGRRLLTTRVHVTGPFLVPVGAEILVARRPDAPVEPLRTRVVERLTGFLDPLNWPFGRDVHVSELYQVLERTAGVDHVPEVFLIGGPDRLVLGPHQLPQPAADPARIVIGTTFVEVSVVLRAQPALDEAGRRVARLRTREIFHPLHDAARTVTAATIRAAVREALGPGAPQVTAEVTTDPAHQIGTGVRLQPGELAEVVIDA
ncbi:hypothetical protein BJY16_007530 [Actinoplanes octamycinicus]|uniref:Baseplate protein J-like domain-containing protein n=1 Tax=Actinoplanes octamycinicus TaxID=135948 RepID=A0A7W7H4Z4_9ACTN|nr:baseplate J/gp47 family protein [Actinoplanes octamycinicus]MBB4744071.1 hypothetical protein [Actinoplanes octamycinicus]GIE56972.1 hypothetical protein Aoc01nite_23740 [Actinoplanes octamycinicus]